MREAATAAKDDFQLTSARLQTENRGIDQLLQAFTFLLAFLLASFPVHNSDVWLQLRTGQMIAQGEFTFGQDPFSYTTTVPWWHTAWLWDLAVYGIYQLGGGPGLVLLRGFLALGITAFMMAIRRREGSLFAAVLCVALGVLVMSSRFRFRSELVSVFLLAATLYLLYRPARAPVWRFLAKPFAWTHDRAWVLLPPLFALWANLDYWFFLGPAAVALFWLGEKLQSLASPGGVGRETTTAGEQRSLLFVFVIGTAACLLNPNHYHVFQLPGELYSEALRQIGARTEYSRLNVSPFNFGVYWLSGRLDAVWYRPRGLGLAEWAYYALVMLGFASFALNWFRVPWSRVLLWLGFFALGAWQTRNAAFFAVVAAPLMTLNFQEWLLARGAAAGTVPRLRAVPLELARLAALGALLLICLAILRVDHLIDPRNPRLLIPRTEGLVHRWRGFGFSMVEDPSKSGVSRQLASWGNELPGKPFFYDWRDQPAYSAWFNPGARHFLDERFLLHGPAIREFFDVRRALEETGNGPPEQRDERIRQIFEKYDVSHLVISQDVTVRRPSPLGSGRDSQDRLVDILLEDKDRRLQPKWVQLGYVDGDTFVLAWTGSKHGEALAKLAYDAQDQAFRHPRLVPPPNGPEMIRGPSSFASWLEGQAERDSAGVSAAAWHLLLAEVGSFNSRIQMRRHALSYFPLAGSPANVLSGVPLPPLLPLDNRLSPLGQDLSGAELYLAIRAARRAIADSYSEGEVAGRITRGRAHAKLYQAFVNLYQIEGEVSPRNLLRDLQVTASLRQAVADTADVPLGQRDAAYLALQLDLVGTYLRKGYLDLAIAHYGKAVELASFFGLNRERFETEYLRQLPQPAMRQLGEEMKKAESNYRTLRSTFAQKVSITPDPAVRAQTALGLKLAEEARLAMEKTLHDYGRDPNSHQATVAMNQLLNLYLELGYLPEAKALLLRHDAMTRLGPYTYHDLAALVAGALGEYEDALFHRREADAIIQREMADKALAAAQLQSLGGLAEAPGPNFAAINQWNEATSYASRRAEQWVQMGQLALEAGWTQPRPPELAATQVEAAECFRKAVEELHPQGGMRILASRYHRFVTGQWLKP